MSMSRDLTKLVQMRQTTRARGPQTEERLQIFLQGIARRSSSLKLSLLAKALGGDRHAATR